MSVNRVHAVMLERYESRRAHGRTSAAALLDRAVTESFPRRFRRNVSHRGAVNAAIAGRSGSALVRNPAAVPRGIEHLDFSPHCQLGFLDNGFRCDRAATAYVEFHMVGYCKRFDCDEDGNACGYVCACHLDALEYTAECTVRELQPATRMRRLSRRIIRCPTCDRSIRSAADILQVVVMI
jgi:hypothetical protein